MRAPDAGQRDTPATYPVPVARRADHYFQQLLHNATEEFTGRSSAYAKLRPQTSTMISLNARLGALFLPESLARLSPYDFRAAFLDGESPVFSADSTTQNSATRKYGAVLRQDHTLNLESLSANEQVNSATYQVPAKSGVPYTTSAERFSSNTPLVIRVDRAAENTGLSERRALHEAASQAPTNFLATLGRILEAHNFPGPDSLAPETKISTTIQNNYAAVQTPDPQSRAEHNTSSLPTSQVTTFQVRTTKPGPDEEVADPACDTPTPRLSVAPVRDLSIPGVTEAGAVRTLKDTWSKQNSPPVASERNTNAFSHTESAVGHAEDREIDFVSPAPPRNNKASATRAAPRPVVEFEREFTYLRAAKPAPTAAQTVVTIQPESETDPSTTQPRTKKQKLTYAEQPRTRARTGHPVLHFYLERSGLGRADLRLLK